MGINEWKRTDDYTGGNYGMEAWKKDYSFIRLWKPAFPYKENKIKGLFWNVQHREGRHGEATTRRFKTRLQALEYAVKYMRSH